MAVTLDDEMAELVRYMANAAIEQLSERLNDISNPLPPDEAEIAGPMLVKMIKLRNMVTPVS